MTMYSSQSCTLAGASTFVGCPRELSTVLFCIDCLDVNRATICRIPEFRMPGSCVARSDTIRSPVKKVFGRRSHLRSVQVTFWFDGRASICLMSFSARPSQQMLRSRVTSPLGRCESESSWSQMILLTWQVQCTFSSVSAARSFDVLSTRWELS